MISNSTAAFLSEQQFRKCLLSVFLYDKYGFVYCFVTVSFVASEAGVVSCEYGKLSRSSCIVKFKSYFWSFEIIRSILGNQVNNRFRFIFFSYE